MGPTRNQLLPRFQKPQWRKPLRNVQHCGWTINTLGSAGKFPEFFTEHEFWTLNWYLFFYLSLECQDALGMENGKISNGDITASSEVIIEYHAYQGRLNFKKDKGKIGAWTAREGNGEQWLQVDLGSQFTRVTGVATQGREDSDKWVTKYKLQYSNETNQFQYYKEKGQNMVRQFYIPWVLARLTELSIFHSGNIS